VTQDPAAYEVEAEKAGAVEQVSVGGQFPTTYQVPGLEMGSTHWLLTKAL